MKLPALKSYRTLPQGGLTTKVKALVTGVSAIALSSALSTPLAAQDIVTEGTSIIYGGETAFEDLGTPGALDIDMSVAIDGDLTATGTVDAGTITDGTATLTGGNLTTGGTVSAGAVDADTVNAGTITGDSLATSGTVSAGAVDADTVNTGTLDVSGSSNLGGDAAVGGDLDVAGDSVFSGAVDIAGPTNINDTLNVLVGDTTLDVNGSSFNVQVGTSTSNLDMTSTNVSLTADGNGFSAGGGNAAVFGTTSAVVAGGTSSITVSNAGVALSGSGGAPVVLSGIADPLSATDAVNLRTLERELGALESELSGGIAQTMAMTQLPYPDPNQQYSFGLAVGGFNGEAGFAMGGAARLSDTMVMRAAASYSDAGGTGGAVGIGWSW